MNNSPKNMNEMQGEKHKNQPSNKSSAFWLFRERARNTRWNNPRRRFGLQQEEVAKTVRKYTRRRKHV